MSGFYVSSGGGSVGQFFKCFLEILDLVGSFDFLSDLDKSLVAFGVRQLGPVRLFRMVRTSGRWADRRKLSARGDGLR